jgi:hypothetical protein
MQTDVLFLFIQKTLAYQAYFREKGVKDGLNHCWRLKNVLPSKIPRGSFSLLQQIINRLLQGFDWVSGLST